MPYSVRYPSSKVTRLFKICQRNFGSGKNINKFVEKKTNQTKTWKKSEKSLAYTKYLWKTEKYRLDDTTKVRLVWKRYYLSYLEILSVNFSGSVPIILIRLSCKMKLSSFLEILSAFFFPVPFSLYTPNCLGAWNYKSSIEISFNRCFRLRCLYIDPIALKKENSDLV